MLEIARKSKIGRLVLACAIATTAVWFMVGPAAAQDDGNNDDSNGDNNESEWEVVGTDLNNPRGLAFGPDGSLYVAEAGKGGEGPCVSDPEGEGGDQVCYGSSGAIMRIWDGHQREISRGYPSFAGADGSFASGIHDISVGDDGTVYTVAGLGAHPADRRIPAREQPRIWVAGSLIDVDPDSGAWNVIRDVALWEWSMNPDEGEVDTNPYSVLAVDDGWLVADAGGNSIVHVAEDGTMSTFAVFPDQEVDLPPEFVQEGGPTSLPMQAVPTSIAKGPDGAYYVGQLTGFPFPVGGASVWRIEDGGEPEVYAEGFTNIIDITFDNDGNLLVLEIAKDGLLAAEAGENGGELPLGALIRVNSDGEQEEIASEGLYAPGGVAVDDNGDIYVSNCSVCAGDGHIVKMAAQDEGEGGEEEDGDLKVVAEDLNNPRGLAFSPDGTLYVAEAGKGGDGPCVPSEGEGEGPSSEDEPAGEVPGGAEPRGEGGEENGEGGEEAGGLCYGSSGAITRIGTDGVWEISGGYPSLAEGDGSFATGLHDVSVGEDGSIYGVVGLGAHPGERMMLASEEPRAWVFGSLLEVDPDTGHWEVLNDVSAYEWMENPDDGEVDSNPYSVLAEEGGQYVVDAGGNSLVWVADDGTIETVAVFPVRDVERPDELPAEVFPDMIPMQAVPTSIAKGPDGAYYVGQLTGFPFPVGGAKVWRIEDGGEPEVYAEGFTNIIDITFDKDGNLLVLEIAKDGLLAAEAGGDGGELPMGALIRVNSDGEQEEIASEGLYAPGGVAVDDNGDIYITNCSVCAGDGEVVMMAAAD